MKRSAPSSHLLVGHEVGASYSHPYRKFVTRPEDGLKFWRSQRLRIEALSDVQPAQACGGLPRKRFIFLSGQGEIKQFEALLVLYIAWRATLSNMRLATVASKWLALENFMQKIETKAFLKAMGGDVLRVAGKTVKDYLGAMISLRLTNVDTMDDRGSRTMRFTSVCLLGMADICFPSPVDLLYAAYLGVCTGGRAFAIFLRGRLQQPSRRTPLGKMYAKEAVSGWEDLPAAEPSGDEGEDTEEDDSNFSQVHAASGAYVLPSDVGEGERSVGMGEQRLRAKKIVQVTLELVREFRQNHGWADISHRGFRPMKALGFDKLEGVLQTLVDLSPPWVRSAYGLQEVFARSGFPFLRCQGLVAKVVADRWDELTQGFVFRSLDSQWVTVPRAGCAREYLSMLQGSTAAFGVGSWQGAGSPVDYGSLSFVRKLRTRLEQLAARRGFQDVAEILLGSRGLSVIENCLCCGMKPLHALLDIRVHRAYRSNAE